jgi:hypothetical protein
MVHSLLIRAGELNGGGLAGSSRKSANGRKRGNLVCGEAQRREKGRGPETEEWGWDDPMGNVWGGM